MADDSVEGIIIKQKREGPRPKQSLKKMAGGQIDCMRGGCGLSWATPQDGRQSLQQSQWTGKLLGETMRKFFPEPLYLLREVGSKVISQE